MAVRIEKWPATLAGSVIGADSLAKSTLLVVGGAALTAVMAQVSFHLPFTPVPITLQTLAVLLTGATLGSRRGALTQVVYVLLGLVGLPVFAGGTAGAAQVLGASGGYLAGFVVAGYVTGLLAERGWDRRARSAWVAMLAGEVAVYGFGLAWLARYVGWSHVIVLGLLPFVVGDLLKMMAASALLPGAWTLVGREGRHS